MDPYPFASLNHFTCPSAIPSDLSLRGSSAPACARGNRGVTCRYWQASYKQKNAARLLVRAACVSISSIVSTPCEPGTAARITCGKKPVNRILAGRRISSLQLYQSRQWARAVPRAEPAGNGHRKPAGGAAGDQDVKFADTREFTDQGLGRRRVLAEAEIRALAVGLVGYQRAVRNTNRFVQIARDVVAAPAVVRERACVLRADDEHRVRVQREVLAVPEAGHRPAERACQALGRAARVVGDAVRRLARKQCHSARAQR